MTTSLASWSWLESGRRKTVVGLSGAALCALAAAATHSASSPRTQAEASALTPAPVRPETLCLAPSPAAAGALPWKRALAAARARPALPESWVELGRHWLVLAQTSADAGYTW